MPKCNICENQIRFIHNKKDKSKIVVDAEQFYFLPPNGFNATLKFINKDGSEVEGRLATDGMIGYRRHECC